MGVCFRIAANPLSLIKTPILEKRREFHQIF